MNAEIINFKTDDGVLTDGFIIKNNSKKILIATHGMSSNCFKKRELTIAKYVVENGVDFLGYNNRGSELTKYIKKVVDGKEKKVLSGTSYEDPEDGYFDIKGAIEKTIELGYTDIYLQGHSLGSTKTLYSYNKFKNDNSKILKYIKGIILLSLIDIPKVLKIFLNENFMKALNFANEKETNGEINDLMPRESFIHPISIKTFLKYAKYYEKIDFAKYSDKEYNFKELNNIDVPLFMRWGNQNEMIEQNADVLVEIVNCKLNNKIKNIGFIDGADHGYTNKEELLAGQIIEFIKSIDSKK